MNYIVQQVQNSTILRASLSLLNENISVSLKPYILIYIFIME